MNRIQRIFERLRAQGGKALMPFVVAGDPNLAATAAILPALEQAGASICELGVPFSDPIADGPVIQESMTHALGLGVRPAQILEMIAAQRARLELGVVLMVSYSIVYRLGGEAFIQEAARAGVDGFIFPDLPVEESAAVRDQVAAAGLTCSFLIAPTTPAQRAQRIARACTGFVYVLARAGLTGERTELPTDLPARIAELRQVTDLPIAVGFGVSSPEQVAQVVKVADAAIVGSAIVRRLTPYRQKDAAAAAREASAFVRQLAVGLRGTP